jgi:murein DD-endopeptidase MepM/ murein hydrolase activator NlpD
VGPLDAVVVAPAERLEVRALGPGQTLGAILADQLDIAEQRLVLMAFREQASPRRMRVGTEITFRYRGEDDWLRGVDVTLSPDETLRLTRDGVGWSSRLVGTATWTDTLYVAGDIEGSLWASVVASEGLDGVPASDRARLLDHLDRVFQWQIDFHRQIRDGDRFRVAFERRVRPDGTMRGGRILAAELVNRGTVRQAIWFDTGHDGDGSYYDRDGRSLRGAFLKKPLEFRRISSRFDPARLHPILKTWRAHRGVDYAAAAGTPIMATADGVVTHRGPLGGLGNAVVIEHANGYRTRYGHLSRFAAIRVGQRIGQGETVGFVGATGLATAPHLHYELWRHDRAVDPLSIDVPAGEPVPPAQWARWTAHARTHVALLDRPAARIDTPAADPITGADLPDGDG